MAKYITMTDLSIRSKEIFDKVQSGETLIVLRHNKPIAALVPLKDAGEDLSAWSFMLKDDGKVEYAK